MVKLLRRKSHYKHINGRRLIEVKVRTLAQLFDARDPAPFREKDLDDDFFEYVSASAREFGGSTPPRIRIYVEEREESQEVEIRKTREIANAFQAFLEYKIDLKESDLKYFLRNAQKFLLFGILILVSCLLISKSLRASPNENFEVLAEGFTILGWVSMWKPVETILYDWFPIYETLKLFRLLKQSELELFYNAKGLSS